MTTNDLLRPALVISLAVSGAGCTPRDMLAKLATPEADRYARAFIDTLRLRPAKSAQLFLIPSEAGNDAMADSIAIVQRYIPAGQRDSMQLVNVSVWESGTPSRFARRRPGRWWLWRLPSSRYSRRSTPLFKSCARRSSAAGCG